LHQKLDNALNLLIGQSVQRQKFITEFRASKIQTDLLPESGNLF